MASQRQIAQRVADVLASLPARRMRVFILYRAYGHSRAEIAGLLGISEAAVAKHLVRATLDCSHALRNLYLDLGAMPARSQPRADETTLADDERH
ncbi:RNA polymerase factor sigma-70 [compost metagenome]